MSETSEKRILCIGAHPDDCDLNVAGSATIWREKGYIVRFVSVTDGSRGHYLPEYIADPESLASRRLDEAMRAAAVIGAEYLSMGVPDGEVYVTPAATEDMTRMIREFKPDLIVTNRPCDYHRDHRYTAQLVLDTIYILTVPAYCPDTPILRTMPVVAYWADSFTEMGKFRADNVVIIDQVMEQKTDMVAAHESQMFEWLPWNGCRLEKVPAGEAAKIMFIALECRARAKAIKTVYGQHTAGEFAEAFQISEYGTQPTKEELDLYFM